MDQPSRLTVNTEYRQIPNASSPTNQLFIGNLLNHFLEVLQFNSHEVAQFEMIAKNREEGAESNFIGAGKLPFMTSTEFLGVQPP